MAQNILFDRIIMSLNIAFSLTFVCWLITEKPVIEPFVVPSLVHTGQRLSITCTVSRGDPPLTIKWLHNEHIIDEDNSVNSMIKVHHLTDYSSTLLFETVTKKQRGITYTYNSFNTAISIKRINNSCFC